MNPTSAEVRGTVLIVDDQPPVARAFARLLRGEPLRVLIAHDPTQVPDIVEREAVDVVVSDQEMPQLDGSALLALSRRTHPRVGRVLLTGRSSIAGAAQAVNEAAVMRFLLKPVDRAVLLEAIYSALDAIHADDPAADHALLNEILEKAYLARQPLFDRHGKVMGHELLVRSDSSSFRGPPNLFALASKLGRERELERRLRDRAAEVARTSDTLLFVNVNPSSLNDPELYSETAALSKIAGRVVLEITERSSLTEVEDVAERGRALRALGYQLAIDDLGSGYSSLNMIATLAPNVIKLDMHLIRGIDGSDMKQRLVRSVSALARELGALTVAEGIETLPELEHLLAAGCDIFQGYLLGRPGRETVFHGWPLPT